MELEHAIGFAGKLRGCCPPSSLELMEEATA